MVRLKGQAYLPAQAHADPQLDIVAHKTPQVFPMSEQYIVTLELEQSTGGLQL